MSYDPLTEVIDEPLSVSDRSVRQLEMLKESEKFTNLPGTDTAMERARLSQILNELLEPLIADVKNNPSKLWVMSQFQVVLKSAQMEDTEARERVGAYIEQIMDILNIQSSDGLLDFYL
jgi:anion-transporting  ArsA/GET3 family ATPase